MPGQVTFMGRAATTGHTWASERAGAFGPGKAVVVHGNSIAVLRNGHDELRAICAQHGCLSCERLPRKFGRLPYEVPIRHAGIPHQ